MRRRGEKEIAHDIIQAADGGARKTAIMYASRLNPSQLRTHLQRLLEEGFLEQRGENSLYRATAKGRRYLKAFERYSESIQSVSEQERALDEFWQEDEESMSKEVVNDNQERRK
jgi:predicted transcriptional regulator